METMVESLPNEVIFCIFSFLGQSDLMACFNVCKNWTAVVLELDSWKEEKLTLQSCHDLKFLQMIFQKLPEDLALLELTRSQLFMSSNKFTLLEFNFPKLHILDLSFTDITCQNLLHAISKLDLSKLLLRGCSNVADPFFLFIKQASPSRRPHLEHLQMIDVGDTSCTIESLKILIDVQLLPDLLVIDIAGLYFRFIDLKQICAAHPELRSHLGDGLFLKCICIEIFDNFY